MVVTSALSAHYIHLCMQYCFWHWWSDWCFTLVIIIISVISCCSKIQNGIAFWYCLLRLSWNTGL